jgi:putative intracellular protease/amidase
VTSSGPWSDAEAPTPHRSPTIASPDGGALEGDGFSDPEDPSGYSSHDLISLGFKRSPTHAALLADTVTIADIDVEEFDAVLFVGGQGPMYTFMGNAAVYDLARAFYEAGRITAVICHATCILLEATTSDGRLLVDGKTWTGFANSEEDFADAFVGSPIQPFRIEDRARELTGTNFVVDSMFEPFAVRDGKLVTSQQQYSGPAAAELVIEALGVRPRIGNTPDEVTRNSPAVS